LSTDKKDAWGIPQLITSVGYDDNDEKMIKDFLTKAQTCCGLPGLKHCSD